MEGGGCAGAIPGSLNGLRTGIVGLILGSMFGDSARGGLLVAVPSVCCTIGAVRDGEEVTGDFRPED